MAGEVPERRQITINSPSPIWGMRSLLLGSAYLVTLVGAAGCGVESTSTTVTTVDFKLSTNPNLRLEWADATGASFDGVTDAAHLTLPVRNSDPRTFQTYGPV